MMKTYSLKASEIERKWHVIDASGQVLGRVAIQAVNLLMGKNKPTFSRHLNMGDYVIVINAEKVAVTGNKAKQKFYYRHSNYPGGLKATSFEDMIKTHPERVIEHAVKGMLPYNKLRAQMMKKLRVYAGEAHPHQSQLEVVPTESEEKK